MLWSSPCWKEAQEMFNLTVLNILCGRDRTPVNPSSLYALLSTVIYGVGDFSAGLAWEGESA